MNISFNKPGMLQVDYKLAAFDLDGTLLDFNMELPQDSITSLRKLTERGIIPVIISGRPVKSILDVVKTCSFPIIAGLNGARIYSTGEKNNLFCSKIASMHTDFIQNYLRKESICSLLFSSGQVYTTGFSNNKFTMNYVLPLEPRPISELKDYSDIISVQIMAGSEKESIKVKKDLEEKTGNDLLIEDCGFNFLQINKKGIDKAFALKYIIDFLNIPAGQTIAVGDSNSDISMIRTAGWGIGMKNGAASLLAASDDVTEKDNNHNGALELILKKYANKHIS